MAAARFNTWPRHRLRVVGSAPAFGTAITLNSTTSNDWGVVWEADTSRTITGFRYRVAGITGTPGVLRVSAQTVSNTTGLGTGTIYGATNNAYQDISSHGTAGTFKTVTFGESFTVSRRTMVAFVLKPLSGTWDASNLVTISPTVTGVEIIRTPYPFTNAAKATPALPLFIIDTTDGPIGFPVETLPTTSLAQTGTPDEVGLKITIPAFGSTNIYDGVDWSVSTTASRLFDLVVYDNSDTVLDTSSYDTDYLSAGAGTSELWFSAPLTLTAGSSYRVTIKAQSAASTIGTLYALTVPASGDMAALCPGATMQWTERTDGGAWTDTPTKLPLMQLRYASRAVGSGLSAPKIGPGLLVRA